VLSLVLLAALVVSPDQPVAPADFGPVPSGVYAVAAAPSQLAVAHGSRDGDTISFVSDESSAAVAVVPGSLRGFQALDDGFLLTYYTPDSRFVVAKLYLDGTLGAPRDLEPLQLLASNGDRVLALTELGEVIVLDGEGSIVARAGRHMEFFAASEVSAAAGDENFLLVWTENDHVYARPVSFEGAFSGARQLIAEDGERPQVATDGRRFLVTWNRTLIYEGRRVSSDGVPVSETFKIADGWPSQFSALEWDGTKYIFLFDHPDAELHRVDITRSGVPGEPRLQAGQGGYRAEIRPHIASSAAGTVIAWTQALVCGVAATGYMSVNDGPALLVTRNLPGRGAPVTAPLGTGFATAWLEQTDALRARMRVGDGEVLDLSTEYAINRSLLIATAGDRVLVSWGEYDIDGGCAAVEERHFAVVDARGMIVGRGSFRVSWPSITLASNGSEFVFLWTENHRSGADDLLEMYALRVSRDGRILDAQPKRVTSQLVSRRDAGYWQAPTLTWTGQEYLAVWQQGTATNVLRMQRLSPLLDPIESTQTLTGSQPSIASGPHQTLLVFAPGRGLLLPSMQEIVFDSSAGPNTRPLVAAWGTEFVVVVGANVYRVLPDGTVLPMTTLPSPEATAIATNGSRVQIVYEKGIEVLVRTVSVPRARAVRH
jgi:hypothetical protein